MHTYVRPINRRDFLRTTGAGLVVLPHIGLAPFLRSGSEKARIALVRTSDRKRGVAQALGLLDLSGVSGKRVLLKPNFNTAGDTPASTHNDTLSQLVYELHERGAREITLGESSGPPDTRGVMEQKGIFDLASDLRFGVVNYEEIPEADWIHFGANGTHWPEGFWLPRHVLDAEYNVSTCCLKTHRFGGVFTMSLKLSVGLTPKNIRMPMHRSPDMRRMIAELNTGYQPQLIVLDGVVAFTDGGPSNGELKQANVIVAGDDRVAIDAVGLAVLKEVGSNEAIMGRKIFEQEQMARAAELGLGITSTDQIEFVTPDAASRAYAERLEGILALG
ncbi:MAG: DUF362 domain-containing protein [Gemmatimonadota bacterium]|nr:MAG: DUF362 domain-containing protein [Gemmatimonadota bacterium]